MTNRNRAQRADEPYVAHPIHVQRREYAPHVQAGLEATVECEVQKRTVPVADCQQCERFKSVEVHEGAYVVLCRVCETRTPTANAEDDR
jgi:hypothetical protein